MIGVTEQPESTRTRPRRGWILYDGECRLCRNLARRFRRMFESRGFALAPLQAPWVARENNLQPGDRPSEMRVRTVDGGDFGGANAVLFLVQFVWWGGPLRLVARIPGGQTLLNRIYREIAARRSCDGGACLLRQPSE